MEKTIKEVVYKCSDGLGKRCTNTQTLRYGPDEAIWPVTNCVPCRAGFNLSIPEQLEQRAGMFPVGKPVFSH